MEKATHVKPGLNVHIVLTVDLQREATDVRGAIVYDIDGTDVILSQTNPPITGGRHIGKDVAVTYLIKEAGNVIRHGFNGKVVDIIHEYNLSSSDPVPAIRVRRRSDSKQYDLRMHYRLKPRVNDYSIALYLGNEKVSLMDISIGGARFSYKSGRSYRPGDVREMALSIDGKWFRVEVRNSASRFPSDARRRLDLQLMVVQFLNMDKACSRLLNVKILEIQREMLSLE